MTEEVKQFNSCEVRTNCRNPCPTIEFGRTDTISTFERCRSHIISSTIAVAVSIRTGQLSTPQTFGTLRYSSQNDRTDCNGASACCGDMKFHCCSNGNIFDIFKCALAMAALVIGEDAMSIYGTQREAGTPVTKWSNLSVLVEKQEDVHILWIKKSQLRVPYTHKPARLNPDQKSSALQSSPAQHSPGSPPRSCSQSGSILLGTSVLPSPAKLRIPTPELLPARPGTSAVPGPRGQPDAIVMFSSTVRYDQRRA
ncbi:hypothetical protein Bbelb_109930 [Branchiostoma belcheri]|nr:hypothetical protein Bbelb_109930 [Branchiostoma belcheri]